MERIRERSRGALSNSVSKGRAELLTLTEDPLRQKNTARPLPGGCAACSRRRPGWFCFLSSAVLADLELATSTFSLPPQTSLFAQGEEARTLYLICDGYLKLIASNSNQREMIVRLAGPGAILGLYAAFAHSLYEVSAKSLTAVHLRHIERNRFIDFLRNHKEAQLRAVEGICQAYALTLQQASRIAMMETVATRLGRLLLELAHQIGEEDEQGELSFPLLLTREEIASMTGATRETVTRTLIKFRRQGWISIEDALVTIHEPARLQTLEQCD